MSEPQPETTGQEAVLIGEITVQEFLADDGERYHFVDYGDMPMSTVLGMLRLAEHWVIKDHNVGDDDEDDD